MPENAINFLRETESTTGLFMFIRLSLSSTPIDSKRRPANLPVDRQARATKPITRTRTAVRPSMASTSCRRPKSARGSSRRYGMGRSTGRSDLPLGTMPAYNASSYPGYAFANVTVPATTVSPVPASADTYLFWDKLHPTEIAHKLLGDAVFNTIAAGPLVVAAANWTPAGLTLKIGGDSLLHVYVTGTTTDAVPPFAPAYVTSVQITGPRSGSGNLTVDSSAGNPIPGGGLIETGSGIVTLLGSNTYKDTTTVTSGELIVATPTALAHGSTLIVGANAAQFFGSAPIVAAPTISPAASATAPSTTTSALAKEAEVQPALTAAFPGAGAGRSAAADMGGASVREKAIQGLWGLGPSAWKAVLPENRASAFDSDSRQDKKTLANLRSLPPGPTQPEEEHHIDGDRQAPTDWPSGRDPMPGRASE